MTVARGFLIIVLSGLAFAAGGGLTGYTLAVERLERIAEGLECNGDPTPRPFLRALSAASVTIPPAARSALADTSGWCHLLRDIHGNPFRPAALDPAWLGWNGGAVRNLAQVEWCRPRI